MLKRKDPEFRNTQTWVQSPAQSVPKASCLTALTSQFSMVWKWYALSRNCTWNFGFWWAHPLVMRAVAVSSKKPQRRQPHNHEGKQQSRWAPLWTLTAVLGSLSLQHRKRQETCHTLLGFVRGFCPTAGSRRCSEHTEGRLGWVNRFGRRSILKYMKYIFDLWYFQLTVSLSGPNPTVSWVRSVQLSFQQ